MARTDGLRQRALAAGSHGVEEAVNLIRKRHGSHQGRKIDLYTISNNNGLVVSISTFGGVITAIRVPDRAGKPVNVLLGRASLADYCADTECLGAIIGRCADRIGSASFKIDGMRYELSANCGVHHLHGGFEGFSKKVWEAEPFRESRGCGLQLSLTSPDGEEGYPGTLDLHTRYLLTPDNRLIIEYTAASDRATAVNLTHNLCFNLAGGGTVDDHVLRIHASGHIPLNEERFPLGTLRRVDGTSLDLRAARAVGSIRAGAERRLEDAGRLRIYYALDDGSDNGRGSITLFHPGSGRSVTIKTSQPCLHLSVGMPPDRECATTDSGQSRHDEGVCLLPQHFPDSPNHRAFPSVILPSGQIYRQSTSYQFQVLSPGRQKAL